MSRIYRIRISESRKEHLRVDDGFQFQLEILNVLSVEQMRELLARELEALGFRRDGDTMVRNDEDGVELCVGLQNSTVTARLFTEKEVEIEVEKTRGIEEEVLAAGRKKLESDVKEELQKKVERKQEELAEENTEILNRKLRDLRAELNPASNRAIAAALKIRAQQIGDVQEISENPETGEITIRVEV